MDALSDNLEISFRNLRTTTISHHPTTLSTSQFHALGGTQTTYDPPPPTRTATPLTPTSTSITTTQGRDESAANSDKVFRWILLATTIGILIIAICLGWRLYKCGKSHGMAKEKARVDRNDAVERGRFELPTKTAARVSPPRVEMADLSEMREHSGGEGVGIGGDGLKSGDDGLDKGIAGGGDVGGRNRSLSEGERAKLVGVFSPMGVEGKEVLSSQIPEKRKSGELVYK